MTGQIEGDQNKSSAQFFQNFLLRSTFPSDGLKSVENNGFEHMFGSEGGFEEDTRSKSSQIYQSFNVEVYRVPSPVSAFKQKVNLKPSWKMCCSAPLQTHYSNG